VITVATTQRNELARSPLKTIAPKLASIIGKMSLAEIAALVAGGSAPSAESAPRSTGSVGAGSIDDIARAILALPDVRHRLREVERAVVTHALAATKGNVSAAARLLGVERKALERRVERHKITVRRGG
jgi:DNA-binding NtrC family response regulator